MVTECVAYYIPACFIDTSRRLINSGIMVFASCCTTIERALDIVECGRRAVVTGYRKQNLKLSPACVRACYGLLAPHSFRPRGLVAPTFSHPYIELDSIRFATVTLIVSRRRKWRTKTGHIDVIGLFSASCRALNEHYTGARSI